MWSKPIPARKGSKILIRKNKKYTQLFSLITLFKYWLAPFKALQANNFIFSRASVPILSFFNQKEKLATSTTCVTKLTLAAKAVCFEVFKILFGQLVDRMLENKSLHEHKASPLARECATGAYFWPYWSRMVLTC